MRAEEAHGDSHYSGPNESGGKDSEQNLEARNEDLDQPRNKTDAQKRPADS